MAAHDGQLGATGSPSTPTRARARARWGLLAVVALGVVVADQLTKWWATSELGDGHSIDLVWTLRLRLTRNFGSAFSLGQGRGALISVLALVVVGVLLRSGRHATRPAAAVALGLVLGGAVGNLADRAFRVGDGFLGGGVVDFIDLQWWPVFNVADMGVVCGALLLVLVSWRDEAERAAAEGHDAYDGHDGDDGAASEVGPIPEAPEASEATASGDEP
jgi:signal peptidase II